MDIGIGVQADGCGRAVAGKGRGMVTIGLGRDITSTTIDGCIGLDIGDDAPAQAQDDAPPMVQQVAEEAGGNRELVGEDRAGNLQEVAHLQGDLSEEGDGVLLIGPEAVVRGLPAQVLLSDARTRAIVRDPEQGKSRAAEADGECRR
jgi:hypothetical protein